MADSNVDINTVLTNLKITSTPTILSKDIINNDQWIKKIYDIMSSSNGHIGYIKDKMRPSYLSDINDSVELFEDSRVNVNNIISCFDMIIKYLCTYYVNYQESKKWEDMMKFQSTMIYPLKERIDENSIEFKSNLEIIKDRSEFCSKELPIICNRLEDFIKKCQKAKEDIENKIKFNKDDYEKLYHDFEYIDSWVSDVANKINEAKFIIHYKITKEINCIDEYINRIYNSKILEYIKNDLDKLLLSEKERQDDPVRAQEYDKVFEAFLCLKIYFISYIEFNMIDVEAEMTCDDKIQNNEVDVNFKP